MNVIICVLSSLVVLAVGKPCAPDHGQLLLSLNKELLRSLEDQEGLPNPSVHLALRLSTSHNLQKEAKHLDDLKSRFHSDIESSLGRGDAVLGRLALYVLALKSSCYDISTLTFSVQHKSEPILTHLKKQLERERENFAISQRPLTNFYQYSLGILALCLSGVRVNPHAVNKLVHGVQHGALKHGDSPCIDSYAMAGMALQCFKDAGGHVTDMTQLDNALATIKQTLQNSKRPDGHLGNEFSTGLAVQALLAMGGEVATCAASMEAMRVGVRTGVYTNPMAISQTLPALQQRSYLHLKGMECRNEDDTLVLGAVSPAIELPSQSKVTVQVEVVKANGRPTVFTLQTPTGTSLLDALNTLQRQQTGFTFEKESSLWGPFLSVVNGEQARQTDRRYWKLTSSGQALSQGITDYKIQAPQKITITNSSF